MFDAFSKQQISLALALGAFGAATLVIGIAFVGTGSNVLALYALVVVGITVVIRLERLPTFRARFTVGLIAFMVSSIALYVKVALSPVTSSLSMGGHAWRIGFLVLVGAVVNLAVARITANPMQGSRNRLEERTSTL